MEAVGTATIALMRLILAISALVVLGVDSPFTGPSNSRYGVLFLYLVYSALLYFAARRREQLPRSRAMHWLDLAWFLLLVGTSGGTSSVFYSFFLFSVLVASFRWGFVEGIKVTATAAVLSLSLGVLLMPVENGEYVLTLLRPLYLAVLGYMIARWGGSEISQKRRLALLREVSRLPNPRFGIEHTLRGTLERLRTFYRGEVCLAIIQNENGEPLLHLVDNESDHTPLAPAPLDQSMKTGLLSLPPQCAVAFNSAPSWRYPGAMGWYVRHPQGTEHIEISASVGARIAKFLETPSFVSVPLHRRGKQAGRVYLTANQGRFIPADVLFIQQLISQMMPVIENMQLLDEIASQAAVHERRKISRDLHDSTIQPYIGLKIGLEALLRKVPAGNPLIIEIEDLCRMTNDGIAELRNYVGGLKNQKDTPSRLFFQAISRLAEKFTKFYGIEVNISANPDLRINDRLAAELVQIVSEGLSNIRRHTQARRATLNLRREDDNLIAQIINHGTANDVAFVPFTPRSITERTAHLGGRTEVTQWGDGSTAVTVEIPL
ncbi:MAG: hypothetical protein H7X91_06520 [Burkholderiales bacterium]|nr:hypothetical protein [Burkholderiales bacterium]